MNSHAVPVPVRQAVQRAVSYKGRSGNDGQSSGGADEGDGPTESTRLLVNGSSRRRDDRSWVRRWLLDRRRTPGMDSDKKAVRYSARAFQALKMTLLSSTYYIHGALSPVFDPRPAMMMLINPPTRPCQHPAFLHPRRYCSRRSRVGCHTRLHAEFLRHHPPGRRALLRHGADLGPRG